jgi:CelD/BcsL family acetyltransferase involved in cellulose biosynthesis
MSDLEHLARIVVGPLDDGLARVAGTARTVAAVTRFIARRDDARDDLAARWDAQAAGGAATAFQTGRFVATWYATIGPAVGEPLRLAVHDRATGALAALMPLVIRTLGGCRIVEFADCGVSDYNAPVLGPAAPADAPGARLLWTAVRAALPPADLVRFKRMPREIDGRVNPLALLAPARASSGSSNVVTIDGTWADFLAGLKGTLRRQVERHWRAFRARDGAEFRHVTDPAEAARILAALERQQGARLRRRGVPYVLDAPRFAAFYRMLVVDGLAEGSAILTALTRGDEVVATLLGVTRGDTYVMLRMSIGAPEWSACSPGRLVILQTMKMLRGRGFRQFDFSIGDYDYKRRFGAASRPLVELTVALSPRGWPLLAIEHAKRLVRRNRALYRLAGRVLASGRLLTTRQPPTASS